MFVTKSHDSQVEAIFSIMNKLSIQPGIFHLQQCPLFLFSFAKSNKLDLHFLFVNMKKKTKTINFISFHLVVYHFQNPRRDRNSLIGLP